VLPVVAFPTTLASSELMPGGAYIRDGHKFFFAVPGLAARVAAYDPRAFAGTPADVLSSSGMNHRTV
jgi:alcohol dehydrogenase class IV